MKSKLLNYLKVIASIVLIVIGLVFVFNNSIKQVIINENMKNTTLVAMDEVEKNKQSETSYDFDEVEDINWSMILDNQNDLDDLPVIGWISIPDVELSLSIMSGITNQNLLVGAGTMKPDQVMGEGNYALAGHNEGAGRLLFNPLHQVEKQMLIYTTDTEKIYTYRVSSMELVDPSRIDVINDTSKSILTLVTCNADGSERLIVQAEFLESEEVAETTREKLSYFGL